VSVRNIYESGTLTEIRIRIRALCASPSLSLSVLGGAGRDTAAGGVPQLAQAGGHPVPQAARQAGGGGRQGLRPYPPTQEEQQEDPDEGGHGAGGPG
jgi:hypothetical protein